VEENHDVEKGDRYLIEIVGLAKFRIFYIILL